jgi:hypothetical protein
MSLYNKLANHYEERTFRAWENDQEQSVEPFRSLGDLGTALGFLERLFLSHLRTAQPRPTKYGKGVHSHRDLGQG